MSHRCFTEDELAVIAGLPADDPRRRDAAACARCDSLLAAVTTFLQGDDELPSQERERAEAHLASFVQTRLVRPGGPSGADADRGSRAQGKVLRFRVTTRQWLGVAATAAAAAVVFMLLPESSLSPSGILRGGPEHRTEAGIGEVAFEADGGELRLTWAPEPRSQWYRVVVFTAAFDTVAVLDRLTEPALTLGADLQVPAGDEGRYCRIEAVTDGSAVASSRLLLLPNR